MPTYAHKALKNPRDSDLIVHLGENCLRLVSSKESPATLVHILNCYIYL